MKGRTHKSTGVVTSSAMAVYAFNYPTLTADYSLKNILIHATFIGVGIVASLISDIDSPESKAGRYFKFIGQYLVEHRGPTHTLYFVFASYIAVSFIGVSALSTVQNTSNFLSIDNLKILFVFAAIALSRSFKVKVIKSMKKRGKTNLLIDIIGAVFDVAFIYSISMLFLMFFSLIFGSEFAVDFINNFVLKNVEFNWDYGFIHIHLKHLLLIPWTFAIGVIVHLIGDVFTVMGVAPLKIKINFLKKPYEWYYRITKRQPPDLRSNSNPNGDLYFAEKFKLTFSFLYLTPNIQNTLEIIIERWCYFTTVLIVLGMLNTDTVLYALYLSMFVNFLEFSKKLLKRYKRA